MGLCNCKGTGLLGFWGTGAFAPVHPDLRRAAACSGPSSVACGRSCAAGPFPATPSYINPSPLSDTAGGLHCWYRPPQTAAVHQSCEPTFSSSPMVLRTPHLNPPPPRAPPAFFFHAGGERHPPRPGDPNLRVRPPRPAPCCPEPCLGCVAPCSAIERIIVCSDLSFNPSSYHFTGSAPNPNPRPGPNPK